ncbi:MAG: redoxin domain-containing protein [Gemmatimonadetes bacterium]|nr:redoxin domain-containing protein [Gemmatimonadota bacterium]MBT4609198.1 redoxin domain-containing protein [Gemmatimonadota bacterium]MBT5057999.1 redoxin domain-containing protein [Gemmatimonadota bacterium]MBT5141660.1 redoxin domain-containing protein [Gemmatimonadota bacterium]MBT5590963.1 redoxin domain-containing protein [Gemmatimonadota bacterium]
MIAISPDSQQILKRFADRYGIDYPLLSDADSRVIRAWGLLNEDIEPDHKHYGVPHPGMYLVDAEGVIFDKHFGPDYRIRESVANAVQERFGLAAGHDGTRLDSGHGEIRAWFAAPIIRPQQLNLLTIEIDLPRGEHLYGEPLPEGYIPLHIEIEADVDHLVVDEIRYPETRMLHLPVIDERLPVYEGLVTIKILCRGLSAEEVDIQPIVHISMQACDETVCHTPQFLQLKLPLQSAPHDWDSLDE